MSSTNPDNQNHHIGVGVPSAPTSIPVPAHPNAHIQHTHAPGVGVVATQHTQYPSQQQQQQHVQQQQQHVQQQQKQPPMYQSNLNANGAPGPGPIPGSVGAGCTSTVLNHAQAHMHAHAPADSQHQAAAALAAAHQILQAQAQMWPLTTHGHVHGQLPHTSHGHVAHPRVLHPTLSHPHGHNVTTHPPPPSVVPQYQQMQDVIPAASPLTHNSGTSTPVMGVGSSVPVAAPNVHPNFSPQVNVNVQQQAQAAFTNPNALRSLPTHLQNQVQAQAAQQAQAQAAAILAATALTNPSLLLNQGLNQGNVGLGGVVGNNNYAAQVFALMLQQGQQQQQAQQQQSQPDLKGQGQLPPQLQVPLNVNVVQQSVVQPSPQQIQVQQQLSPPQPKATSPPSQTISIEQQQATPVVVKKEKPIKLRSPGAQGKQKQPPKKRLQKVKVKLDNNNGAGAGNSVSGHIDHAISASSNVGSAAVTLPVPGVSVLQPSIPFNVPVSVPPTHGHPLYPNTHNVTHNHIHTPTPYQMQVATAAAPNVDVAQQVSQVLHNSLPTAQPAAATSISMTQSSSCTGGGSSHKNLYAAPVNPLVLSQMQTWKLGQLEGHVQLLRDTSQPVPNAVQVLLAGARKVEEKRAAKRIANRRSACTSRARKKALVAEMTKTNARLRRQAVILSLLPDLVIAIKVDGEITFCSAQVERVLRHKVRDMVGANIGEVLTPSSRAHISGLIDKLVAAEKQMLEESNKEGDESGRSSNSGNNSGAAIVSEQSDQRFPLSVVNVKSQSQAGNGNGNPDASDSSRNGNNPDSGAGDTAGTISRSATQSSLSNSDNVTNQNSNDGSNKCSKSGNSGDDSSSSSDAKNLYKANEALNRNVRFHNEQLKIKKDAKKDGISHKDDVTGDFVTANNSEAKLSSLMMHVQFEKQHSKEEANSSKKEANEETMEDNASSESSDSLLAGVEDRRQKRKRAENASDDSGYRESGESDPSREDSSSTSDTTNGGRPKPLAPTCNICLIRDNLSTIWCEVTSSIRTRSLDEDDPEMALSADASKEKKTKASSSNNSSDDQQSDLDTNKITELLLCLRPIRDGDENVSEELRFSPKSKNRMLHIRPNGNAIKVGSNGNTFNGDTASSSASNEEKKCEVISVNKNSNRPMKKRHLAMSSGEPEKRQAVECQGSNDTEKSAVESLLDLMSSHKK
uniref:PAS domain-containing protein n=1 Tax=Chaetoceros debilis TaxID=122233 RepID=A0A7S3VAF3_9STRA